MKQALLPLLVSGVWKELCLSMASLDLPLRKGSHWPSSCALPTGAPQFFLYNKPSQLQQPLLFRKILWAVHLALIYEILSTDSLPQLSATRHYQV